MNSPKSGLLRKIGSVAVNFLNRFLRDVVLISRCDRRRSTTSQEQSFGEESKEANARAVDEKDVRGIAKAFEGKNAGC